MGSAAIAVQLCLLLLLFAVSLRPRFIRKDGVPASILPGWLVAEATRTPPLNGAKAATIGPPQQLPQMLPDVTLCRD
jgi:hypothetical protein